MHGQAEQREARARGLHSEAERLRGLARLLRAEADQIDQLSFGIARRITPEVWLGKAAVRRHAQAQDERARAAVAAGELEDIAADLLREAARLEEEAAGLRQRARLERWTSELIS